MANNTSDKNLSGPRVVLVTGAAKRLGREIAIELARAGWRVAVHYRDSDPEALETVTDCSRLTAGSHSFQADLSDETQTQALVTAVVKQMGQLDAVVNNASMFVMDTVEDFSHAKLTQHMLCNVAGPIVLAKSLWQHVRERQERGVVLNVLDQKLWNINPDFLSYSLSKAALQLGGKMLAQALAPDVRVCAIAPGLTLPSYLQTNEDFVAAAKYTLTGNMTLPSDIAKAVRFMLETESIAGATLLVDGGQHLVPMSRDVSFL